MDAFTGKILLLTSSLLLSCCVTASPEVAVVKIKNCSNALTLLEIDQCRDKGLSLAKQKLSSKFLELKNSYQNSEPKLVPVFEKMYEGWKQVVLTDCEFDAYYSRGGAAYHAEYSSCLERENLKYYQQLKNIETTP